MALFGLAKGIVKTITGVVTGDGELIAKGLKKTAINAATTIGEVVAGNFMDRIHEDDDPDE